MHWIHASWAVSSNPTRIGRGAYLTFDNLDVADQMKYFLVIQRQYVRKCWLSKYEKQLIFYTISLTICLIKGTYLRNFVIIFHR